MQNQIYFLSNSLLDKMLSKHHYCFRKVFNAQHYLMSVMETWLWSLDADGHAETLFINPAKAFDCIDHDLLIAIISVVNILLIFSRPLIVKLRAYGLEMASFKFIYPCFTDLSKVELKSLNFSYSYFTVRKQKIEINSSAHTKVSF